MTDKKYNISVTDSLGRVTTSFNNEMSLVDLDWLHTRLRDLRNQDHITIGSPNDDGGQVYFNPKYVVSVRIEEASEYEPPNLD